MKVCSSCKQEYPEEMFYQKRSVCKGCRKKEHNLRYKRRRDGKFTGDPNGIGRLDWTSGAVFRGKFKDGKRHGEGYFTFPDGLTHKGTYEKGFIVFSDDWGLGVEADVQRG